MALLRDDNVVCHRLLSPDHSFACPAFAVFFGPFAFAGVAVAADVGPVSSSAQLGLHPRAALRLSPLARCQPPQAGRLPQSDLPLCPPCSARHWRMISRASRFADVGVAFDNLRF